MIDRDVPSGFRVGATPVEVFAEEGASVEGNGAEKDRLGRVSERVERE